MPSPKVNLCFHRHFTVLDTVILLESYAGREGASASNDYQKASTVMRSIAKLYKELKNVDNTNTQVITLCFRSHQLDYIL